MLNRKDIAAQLKEAAKLLEVLDEDTRRARSLVSAARAFESFDSDVEELYREGRLTEVRGVGVRTEREIAGMFEQGVMPLLEDLRARVPDEVKELFAVSGLGAKRIGLLWRSGISGLAGLITAADDGSLAELPGFGSRSVANIRASASFALESRERMRLDEAEGLAEAVLVALATELPGSAAQVAGDLRRRLETVAGIDVVVTGVGEADLRGFAARLLDETETGGLSGVLAGHRLGFTVARPEGFGSALAAATGSDEFVDHLDERAKALGHAELSAVPAAGEAELFELLGLPFVEPELREGREAVAVPDLLELEDIRGVVHNHSTWSDGALPIRGMLAAARALGFDYLALADHSQSSAVANGLGPERVRAQGREIRGLRDELAGEGGDFELLHGIEVDILSDGSLDLPDEILAELDYVVASIHQNFTLSLEDQTERIVRAVHNPHVHILAHPTGRLLLRRPGYEVDVQRVIEACAETGTVIEINANPRRLDLDWRWVRRARDLGCLFSVNPDAHVGDGFDDVRFGVAMARKAGLSRDHVVNSAGSGREFLRRLPKKR